MTQFKTPPQSPEMHAAPAPLLPFKLLAPLPAVLKLQFVRPHILPCQSALTVKLTVFPGASSKPPIPGPVPAWVKIAGQIRSGQSLVIKSGNPPSRLLEGPHLLGLGAGFLLRRKKRF